MSTLQASALLGAFSFPSSGIITQDGAYVHLVPMKSHIILKVPTDIESNVLLFFRYKVSTHALSVDGGYDALFSLRKCLDGLSPLSELNGAINGLFVIYDIPRLIKVSNSIGILDMKLSSGCSSRRDVALPNSEGIVLIMLRERFNFSRPFNM